MFKRLFLVSVLASLMIAGCGGGSGGGDHEGEHSKENAKDHNGDDSHSGGNGNGTSYNHLPNVGDATKNGYMLTAWNDLGMHCMDGKDFSVFSILPPYNNLNAQLKDKSGGLLTNGVSLTYESYTGLDGKINTTSSTKTNFWDFSDLLFPNSNLTPDLGLAGFKTPSKTPRNLTYDQTLRIWKAEGLPITPYNDDGSKNYYPLVKVSAKDGSGKELATALVVLPISDEMDCKRCHASGSIDGAKPSSGWVNDSDSERDFKYNILRLHDERMPNAVRSHLSSLQAKGYSLDPNGLEASARAGKPILCASCHKSNALPGSGISGIPQFTSAIHSYHAHVIDPKSGQRLGDSSNTEACYACHPGAQTKCLRGAMGDAKDSSGNNTIQCQSCHGHMANVGNSNRKGWLDEPNCQACHQGGKRYTSAIDPSTNTLRAALDGRFATNANTPMAGVSLYRMSKGHGGLNCEACHGSTHAIYPAHNADNLLSKGIQGHSGTLSECSSCHSSVPNTVSGGPHGMHPVGSTWVKNHKHVAEHNAQQCAVCHGADYRGTVLSKMFTDRQLAGRSFKKGHKVSCYDCHNGPRGGDDD